VRPFPPCSSSCFCRSASLTSLPPARSLHWYLAIIVNPGAILNPPPPAPPPAAPRKSGRKRNGTVDSDFVVDSPGGSPEVASKHFGGAGRSLREADAEDMVADDDPEEQAARQANEKVARDVAAHEQRKAHDHDREVQAAVASVAEQERRASASAGPVDEMDLDDGARVASSSAVVGSSPRRRTQPSHGAEDDEAMLDISSQSPPPPGQHDVHMHGADDMSDVDIDVRRVRPEVEGGGPGKPDKHVVLSPTRGQGQHTRFPADDADDDDVVVVQEQSHERAAATAASDASDASLEPPDKLGKGKQRLRRGSKKEVVAAEPAPLPEHAEQLGRITLEDDEDESLPGPGDAAPTSAPMQKATSSSSAVTSTSGSSTSAATAAADTEPTSRSAPASTTYGSASSSRPRKSVVVGAPMPFAPQDPEPEREAQLARERAEEEERRRAQAAEEVEMSEEVTSSADRCVSPSRSPPVHPPPSWLELTRPSSSCAGAGSSRSTRSARRTSRWRTASRTTCGARRCPSGATPTRRRNRPRSSRSRCVTVSHLVQRRSPRRRR